MIRYVESIARARLALAGAALALAARGAEAQGLAGWKHHREIKLNTSASGANVPGKVDGFPVAVRLKAGDIDFAEARDDGSDLRFTKADGSPLPFEIEHWDKAAQTAAVWVRFDVAGNSASQGFSMHWGKADAAAASDGKAVFPAEGGYLGVWHLSETGGTAADLYQDASPSQAHGTGVNTKAANTVAGAVGKAHLNVHADKTWIKVDGPKKDLFNPTTPSWTVSIWTRITSWPAASYHNMISKGDASWTLQRTGTTKTFEHCTGATPYHICAVTTADTQPGAWHQLTAVWVKESYLELYYDGKSTDKTTWKGGGTSWSNWRTGSDPVGIGNQGRTSGAEVARWWDGALDEARVMTGTRSVDWIKLDYESQKPDASWLTFGEKATFIRRTLPGWIGPAPERSSPVRDLLGRSFAPAADRPLLRIHRKAAR